MTTFKSCLLVLGVSLSLTACTTLGPDYEEPEVEWADDWAQEWVSQWESTLYGPVPGLGAQAAVEGSQAQPAQVNAATASAPQQQDLAFWWQAFNDPVLNELITKAKAENPNLRIAGLAIAQSRALLGIATGSQYPQVQQASGAFARVDNWPTEGDNSGNNSNLNDYSVGFDVGWELDFWGRFQRGIESADASFFASITNQQNAQILLSAQVAETYYAYVTVAKQIDIATMNADLQKRSLQITQRLYISGQDSELDLQQARTQYLSTLATIPDLQATLQQLRNALAALLGRPPGAIPELANSTRELPSLAPGLMDDIPARLLMRRPDIRTAAWQVASQSAQIGVAEAAKYPAVSLFGTIGWTGSSLNNSVDTLGSGIGPSFTWNLFNYGRLENNVRAQDALLQQVIEGYQNTVLQAARELDDSAVSVVKTREQDAILAEALASSERALKLATTRYREGYSDFQRVLDAQRALAAQSTSYVANQGAHVSAVIEFYKALGGGWEPATAQDFIPVATREIMQQRTDWGDLLSAPLPVPAP